jgi:Tfp pilus assembly protein PilF
VIALYSDEASDANYARAEEAFRKALALNPELPIAHHLVTMVELETGRAREAMVRLLERARSQSADAELFAGLVQACRYAGLDRPAIAAYEHARRLEPQIRTAVCHAYFAAGEWERATETDLEDPPFMTALAMDRMGRRAEARAFIAQRLVPGMPTLFRLLVEATVAVLENDRAAALPLAGALLEKWPLRDPCATYYLARTLVAIEHPRGMELFRRAVEGGFHAYPLYAQDPWLDPLRMTPEFQEVLALAEAQYRDAADAFVAAGGERLLGRV